jgi:hypothetical protein
MVPSNAAQKAAAVDTKGASVTRKKDFSTEFWGERNFRGRARSRSALQHRARGAATAFGAHTALTLMAGPAESCLPSAARFPAWIESVIYGV